jgi:lipopolysaccharide biosynthesis regulator YciM
MGQFWLILIIICGAAMVFYIAFSRRKKKPDNNSLQAYIEGLRSIISGDDQNAFVKLRQAVDLDTENMDAYLKLGDLFRKKGMTDKALQIHRELTLRKDVPPELKNEVNKSLAMDYLKAGMNDKAIDLLQPMIKDDNLREWAESRLLDLYLAGKMWDQAEALSRSMTKRKKARESSDLADIKIMIGRELYRKGEYHKARLAFKEALSLNKDNPFPYIYIAESYKKENRLDEAVEYLSKLCEEAPRYAFMAFSIIEEAFFELGRYGEVEELYRDVLNRDPDNIPARIALAGMLEKKGEIQPAENLLRSVLETDSAHPSAAIRLAKILAGEGRSLEGLEILSDMADRVDIEYQIYKCKKCGQSVRKPEPSCPKCNTIGAFI